MTTTTRIAALFASIFMTFATVSLAAQYAYPDAAPVQLASAAR